MRAALPTYYTLGAGAAAGVFELACLYPLGTSRVVLSGVRVWAKKNMFFCVANGIRCRKNTASTAKQATRRWKRTEPRHITHALVDHATRGLFYTVSRHCTAALVGSTEASDQVWVRVYRSHMCHPMTTTLTFACASQSQRFLGQAVPSIYARAQSAAGHSDGVCGRCDRESYCGAI